MPGGAAANANANAAVSSDMRRETTGLVLTGRERVPEAETEAEEE